MGKVNFFAYGTLRFGVNVGSADLEPDSFFEILSGPGPGGVFGPHVRAWGLRRGPTQSHQPDQLLRVLHPQVRSEDRRVAILDGDTAGEMLSGAGPGAVFAATIRGWNDDGSQLTAITSINFNAFTYPFGVVVAGGDADGDGFSEIGAAAGPAPTNPAEVRGFNHDGAAIVALPGYSLNLAITRYGSRIGFGELTGDATAEILVGLGRDPAAPATVHPHSYDGLSLTSMATFDAFPGAAYGVNPTQGP